MSDANKGLYVSGSPPAPAPASPTSTPEKDERYANTVSSLLPPPPSTRGWGEYVQSGDMCRVPAAALLSALGLPPPLTLAERTSSLLHFFTSLPDSPPRTLPDPDTRCALTSADTQTLITERPSTETSHELSVQTSNRSLLRALAHWPPPASVYAAAPCCAGRKTSPSWRGIFLQNSFSIP